MIHPSALMISLRALAMRCFSVRNSRIQGRRNASCDGLMLAAETVVGLPRSNLVKPKSTAVSAPAPSAVPVPEPSGIRSLEVAATFPQIDNPFAVDRPMPVQAASGSVDVMVEDSLADTHSDAPVALDAHAPSTHDLLARAARLGPARPTLESIVLPNDPILLEKMQPAAAQRRARFRKVVKATLGACLAVCVAAIGASALSPSEASASQSSSGSSTVARTAPAHPLVTIEKLDDAKRGKAVTSHQVTANAAAAVKAKIGKRR